MSQENIIRSQIISKLKNSFYFSHLEVVNESYMHNVPPGSESHFKVIAVSDDFIGMRLIARHRAINQVLADELANHIHALAIHAYTEREWHDRNGAPDSPKCLGGGR